MIRDMTEIRYYLVNRDGVDEPLIVYNLQSAIDIATSAMKVPNHSSPVVYAAHKEAYENGPYAIAMCEVRVRGMNSWESSREIVWTDPRCFGESG